VNASFWYSLTQVVLDKGLLSGLLLLLPQHTTMQHACPHTLGNKITGSRQHLGTPQYLQMPFMITDTSSATTSEPVEW